MKLQVPSIGDFAAARRSAEALNVIASLGDGMRPQPRGDSILALREQVNNTDNEAAATAELAKIGIKVSDLNTAAIHKGGSEGRKAVGACRRALNQLADAAQSSSIDAAGRKRILTACEWLGAHIAAGERQYKLDEDAAAAFAGRPQGGASGWTDQNSGRAVRVLGPRDSVARRDAYDYGEPQCSFGEFVSGVFNGHRGNERIRASLGEGSVGTGGAMVPAPLAAELIDSLRARTVAIKGGARTVIMDSQTLRMARLTGDPIAAWRNENAAVGGTDPTFDAVTFTARSLACKVAISRELLADAANLSEVLLSAFAKSMAVTLDSAILQGSGTAPEPTGVLNTAGIGAYANANYDTWDGLLAGTLAMQNANAPDPSAAIMTPTAWNAIQGQKDSQGRYLEPPSALASLPLLATTGAPADILLGAWSQCLIGMRQEIMLEIFPGVLAGNLQVLFLAHLRADVQLAHPAAFVKLSAS